MHYHSFAQSSLGLSEMMTTNHPFPYMSDAKLWRKEKVESLFPLIFITPTLPSTHLMSAPINSTSDANVTLIHTLLVELQKSRESNVTCDNKETFETSTLKTICGLPQQCDNDTLPTWYLHIFQKH
jgi:hypothetical protein